MKKARVMVADDHTLFREGLRQLLEMERDIEVVGEASDGMEAVAKARTLVPDVILMDINMPVVGGVAAIGQILSERPETGIIVLTMHRQDQYVFDAMRAGARGYLLKDAKPADLIFAIRMVARGASLVDPRMTTTVLKEFRRLASQVEPDQGVAGLTPKEVEILKLLAMGLSNKEIGRELCLAEKTVKNYLSTVFQKLQINDRVQAAIYALKHGLLTEQEIS
ncbi:MAG TPA: response regulator transcription factor [Chloroflexota bacterium]|nr:response regulator transcription factor [Chloroflexota bacterium]